MTFRTAAMLSLLVMIPRATLRAGMQDQDRIILPPGTASDSGLAGDPAPLGEQMLGVEDDGELELLPEEERREGEGPLTRVRIRSRVAGKIQKGEGYTDGRYAGGRLKIYNRLTITHGGWLSAGFLAEKDPGERSAIDHLSGSISFGGTGGFPRIIAGDFRVRSGQRLVFAGGRAFGKGSDVVGPVVRKGWGISSGPTADEFNFFRGFALGASLGSGGIAAFLSKRNLSASLGEDGSITSLDRSGYHRTATEILKRNRVTLKSAGVLGRFDHGDILHVGVNVFGFAFVRGPGADDPPAPGPLVGRRASIDFVVRTPVAIYGELASDAGALSGVGGVSFDGGPGMKVVLAGRSYPPGERLIPAGGFGDGSDAVNERGIYLGAEVRTSPSTGFHGYLDVFSSSVPDRGAVFPARGVDRLLGMSVAISRHLRVTARYRNRRTTKQGTPEERHGIATPADESVNGSGFRFEVRWRENSRTSAGVRIDISGASRGNGSQADRGMMLLADLRTRPLPGLDMKFRAVFFETDSYAARLYETEADLPGSLTNGVVYGKGARWYLLLTWKPSPFLGVSTKFSRLDVYDRQHLGSGPEEISGSVEERVGMQLDVVF